MKNNSQLIVLNDMINSDLEVYAKDNNTGEEFLIGNIAQNGYKLYSLTSNIESSDFCITSEQLLNNYEIEL